MATCSLLSVRGGEGRGKRERGEEGVYELGQSALFESYIIFIMS